MSGETVQSVQSVESVESVEKVLTTFTLPCPRYLVPFVLSHGGRQLRQWIREHRAIGARVNIERRQEVMTVQCLPLMAERLRQEMSEHLERLRSEIRVSQLACPYPEVVGAVIGQGGQGVRGLVTSHCEGGAGFIQYLGEQEVFQCYARESEITALVNSLMLQMFLKKTAGAGERASATVECPKRLAGRLIAMFPDIRALGIRPFVRYDNESQTVTLTDVDREAVERLRAHVEGAVRYLSAL